MTENKAIEFLKGKYPSWGCDEDEYENAQIAIQALEEIQEFRKQGITIEKALDTMCDLAGAENLIDEYRAIGTPDECRTAVERMKPKKLNVCKTQGYEDYLQCSCGYSRLYSGMKYCPNCGQAIDWSE